MVIFEVKAIPPKRPVLHWGLESLPANNLAGGPVSVCVKGLGGDVSALLEGRPAERKCHSNSWVAHFHSTEALSSRSLSALISISFTPGAKSQIRFLLTRFDFEWLLWQPQLQNLKQVASFESLRWKCLSWALASSDKCVIDGESLTGGCPSLSLAKRHFQQWEVLLETFYNGLSWAKIVTFFLLGDHSLLPTFLGTGEECEDTDRKEITRLIHTGQNVLRDGQESSDLEEDSEGWVDAAPSGSGSPPPSFLPPGCSAPRPPPHLALPYQPHREHTPFPRFSWTELKQANTFQRGFTDTPKITNRKCQQHWEPSRLLRVTSWAQEPREQG